MCDLKRIEDISIEDLQAHRWCYYQNDDEGYDAFEHVISDRHPNFSEDIIELELAEFEFSNGKLAQGIYDGSEAFNIVTSSDWYSFWYGVNKPEPEEIERFRQFLIGQELELPVTAVAKWSNTTKTLNGIQYLNSDGEVEEVAI